MEMRKGKFIVIDGTDGSGKATQAELLANRLSAADFEVAIADFPQYGQKSAGLVEEYLNGKYGSAEEVGPYIASILYATDRYDASFKIRKWLNEGKIVISNRYVTANLGHQGGKIDHPLERKHFFDWLYKLEYGLFKIPKPDLNIILHVDAAIAQKLVDNKGERTYVGGKKRDIHEADLNHLKKAEKVYLEIARTFPDFVLIECVREGQIMSRREISDLVWREAIKLLGVSPAKLAPDFKHLHDKQQNSPAESRSRPLTVAVERLSSLAKLPTRAHESDAGLDLYSADYYSIFPGEKIIVQTGIKIAIPEGYAGLIWDKSGLARAGLHSIAGVIDAGYRGEIIVSLINLGQDIYHIAPGQKIAQILIQKIEAPQIVERKISDQTDRSKNGFGSTGLF